MTQRVGIPAPESVLVEPEKEAAAAVLVLSGSSGRVEEERARVFASRGFLAKSIRWFGGPGQAPGICEIPLERFEREIEQLARIVPRVAVLGASKGAEAALLVASFNPLVSAVIAFAPTDVVWANVGAGTDGRHRPPRSSWTHRGSALPFVPYDEDWEPSHEPPAYVSLYRSSRAKFPDRVEAARIHVERITGQVLLIAGGDDQVWDSSEASERIRAIRATRATFGLDTRLVVHPRAGHRAILPGERPGEGGHPMRRGGTAEADRALGEAAWRAIEQVLRGETPAT